MDYSHYSKSQLIDMLVKLKWDFDHLQSKIADPAETCNCRSVGWTNHYSLFPAFVDDSRKYLLIVNSSYMVSFINAAAAKLFGMRSSERFCGQSIFGMLARSKAIETKEIIDHAYFSGKEEQLTNLQLNPDGKRPIDLNASALRVKYNDRIAVRLRLQPV